MTARLPIPGSDDNTWGDILNAFLEVAHDTDGSLLPAAVRQAGAVTSINSKTPTSGSVTLAASDVGAVSSASVGAANGVATLDSNSLLPATELPAATVTASSSGGIAAWQASTAYRVNQLASSSGVTYVCLTAHTSGGSFPGTGANWATWDSVDGSTSTPSLRTLGTGSQQAAAGNDSRFGTGVAGSSVNDVLTWSGSTWQSAQPAANTSATPTADGTIVSMGTSGLPARQDHVHPRTQWVASDHGLASWAFDPSLAVSTSTPLTTAGTLYLVKLHVPIAQNVTNLFLFLNTAGSALTSGQCFAALYQSGNLLGTTADQSTAWASTGLKTMAISGGPIAVAAGDVYVGMWFNGTTGPAPLRGNGNSAVNLNLSATNARYGSANTGLTTTAPSTLGTVAGLSVAYWAGLA